MKMKELLKRIFPVVLVIFGVILLFYPFISDYINSRNADGAIKVYQQSADDLEEEDRSAMLEEAQEYNRELVNGHAELTDPFDPDAVIYGEDYENLLSLDDSGIMAYLEIPKIDVYLPIYHGTSESVLQTAVGHLEGSSLPVGGESTHAVLSGHTGLRTARIFTDLTELAEGDIFYIHVLGETHAYQVDQITIVEPDDTSELAIVEGEDYVTLVTCTPYGVNSERLLVRGVRTEYEEEAAENAQSESNSFSGWDSQWMRQYRRALLAGFVILAVILFANRLTRLIWRRRRRKTPGTGDDER